MKVFISQPMNGRSEDEIMLERQMVEGYLNFLYAGKSVEIIDNLIKQIPDDVNVRVWCLGDSIKQLASADAILFVDSRMALDNVLDREKKNYEDPNGVAVEKMVAKRYGIKEIETISYHNQLEFYRIYFGKPAKVTEMPTEKPEYPPNKGGVVDLDSKTGKSYQERWKND